MKLRLCVFFFLQESLLSSKVNEKHIFPTIFRCVLIHCSVLLPKTIEFVYFIGDSGKSAHNICANRDFGFSMKGYSQIGALKYSML